MQTIFNLWSACWPTLAIFLALGAMIFVAFIVSLRHAIQTDPERMSALDAGARVVNPRPTVFLRRCAWCKQGLAAESVVLQPGTPFQVTDGICPECERTHFPSAEVAEWRAPFLTTETR